MALMTRRTRESIVAIVISSNLKWLEPWASKKACRYRGQGSHTVVINKKLAFRIRKTIIQRQAIHGFATLRIYNVLCVVRKYCLLPGESTKELIVGRSLTNRCDDLASLSQASYIEV